MLSDYEKTIRRSPAKNEEAIRHAEIMVREAGYNYLMLVEMRGATLRRGDSRFDHEVLISRSANLYRCAKSVLRALDPDNAEAFIQSTYGVNTNG